MPARATDPVIERFQGARHLEIGQLGPQSLAEHRGERGQQLTAA
jgi:hypothetical protein